MASAARENKENVFPPTNPQDPTLPWGTSGNYVGVYINAKFAINSHCSYKKNLAIKSLCIFYKPRIQPLING